MVNRNSKRRVAVVTGASRRGGIGTAICRALARNGMDIFFTHWQSYDSGMEWGAEADWPDELAGELRGMGVEAWHAAVDLSIPGAPSGLIDTVTDTFGSPSVLVNNATHSTSGGYMELSAAVWTLIMR